jgi:asparagine synthase (glutamine-hydrolysing)
MCGIAGMVSREPSAAIGPLTLAMTRALRHRGPDGEGFLLGAGAEWTLADEHGLARRADVVLGHRRLSIVDVANGQQPMPNETGSVWVTFNGEIYNHAELREELSACGHSFATRCDTEVLVHAWEEWGERMFARLNGIFALALVDVARAEVVLARDPMGVKPLYIGTRRGSTWWTSELQAAGLAKLLPEEASPEALKLFLTFRFVPSPDTIYRNTFKVPPSHFCRLSAGAAGRAPAFIPYRTSIRSSALPTCAEEWSEALLAELEGSVRRQLMSDGAVASLLSGGLDSSLLTLLMARNLPYAPQTFGIGFRSDGARSEAAAARRAARILSVPLRTTEVEEDEYVASWPEAIRALGEPNANPSTLLIRMLCAEVGRSHKVALCGQGADEPLGGYPRHLVERVYPFARIAPRLACYLAAAGIGADGGRRLGRALRSRDRIDRYVQIFSVFPLDVVDELVPSAEASALDLGRRAVGRWASLLESQDDDLNDLLSIDARLSLADDLLIVGDHTSMASSVELRVPFLDLAFVELAERMPSRFKISAVGTRKWLYGRAARAALPAELGSEVVRHTHHLRPKRGFSAPLGSWFNDPDGMLRDSHSWLAPLTRLGMLDAEVLRDVALSERSDPKRERSVLFSLASWARLSLPPRAEAA